MCALLYLYILHYYRIFFYTLTVITQSTLEVAERLVLEGMEKEMDMPIVWDPCSVEELKGVEVVDIACGLDHSLVLCRE